jgi:hypothetical protein
VKGAAIKFSLCNLCALCASVVFNDEPTYHHRGTESTEVAQRNPKLKLIETLQNKKMEAAKDFDKAFKLDPSLKAQYREFIEKRRLP